MNALQVDPVTGFLDAPNVNGFTAERKIKFLELATEFKNQGLFPKVSVICDALNLNITTFERHLQTDPSFKEQWDSVATHIEYQCISDLHELRRKNPMYMFGLLRYLNPKRWNPNERAETSININVFSDAVKEVSAYRDAEIVGNCPDNALPEAQSSTVEHILKQDASTVAQGNFSFDPPAKNPMPGHACHDKPPAKAHKIKRSLR